MCVCVIVVLIGLYIKSKETYWSVVCNESSCIERVLEKCSDTIEQKNYCAQNHTIHSFKPLSVRFIGISWMVAIVYGGLSFRDITTLLAFFKSILWI